MRLLCANPAFIDTQNNPVDVAGGESCVLMLGWVGEIDPLLIESEESVFLG